MNGLYMVILVIFTNTVGCCNIYLFFGYVQMLTFVVVNFSVMFTKFRFYSFGHVDSFSHVSFPPYQQYKSVK